VGASGKEATVVLSGGGTRACLGAGRRGSGAAVPRRRAEWGYEIVWCHLAVVWHRGRAQTECRGHMEVAMARNDITTTSSPFPMDELSKEERIPEPKAHGGR